MVTDGLDRSRMVARRARRRLARVMDRSGRLFAPIVRAFRHSLQLRVVSATLAASAVLVVVFGVVVAGSITGGMVDERRESAISQVQNARASITAELNPVVSYSEPNLTGRMAGLIQGHAGDPDQTDAPTVLMRPAATGTDAEAEAVSVPVRDPAVVEREIPSDLRARVAEGLMATQYVTINPDGHGLRPFLAVGTPVYTDQLEYELYFLFPLDSQQRVAELVATTLVFAGIALVMLLGMIAGLVTRMVVNPVRSAARTAHRLSAGFLHERMAVRGTDDLARLAESFNSMAENLHQQILRLEEMSRLQRRFTSDVSHELRTPLTTVRMAADLLYDERDQYPAHAARSAELLHDELNRFEELLADLLEISRFDAGFAQLDTEAVELAPIIDSVASSFRVLAANCDVEVRQHMPDEPVIAEIDPRRVQRILRNLIGNAIEHAERKPVCVVMAASETAVAIVIRDRGIGLKDGEEKLVFNRFWRADPSRARQTGGTGLGLSISAEDAKLHNGRLDAIGEPGVGSVFRLSLPLQRGGKVITSPLPLDPATDPCTGGDHDTTT